MTTRLLHRPRRPEPWRRFGTIAATALLAVACGAAAIATGTSGATDRSVTGRVSDATQRGVITWSAAARATRTSELDWGPRCDTTTGTLRLPMQGAPECVAVFHGSNGGATAPGVTATSVKVVIYLPDPNDPLYRTLAQMAGIDDTADEIMKTARNDVEMLSHYFETYGREVVLEPYQATGGTGDDAAAAADATTIATELRPFLVLSGPKLTDVFADTLAANGVVCIACAPPRDDQWYLDHAPYVWDVPMNSEQTVRSAANYVGRRLADHPASHAGDPALVDETRRIGFLEVKTGGGGGVAATFENQLAEAGGSLVTSVTLDGPTQAASGATAAIAKLRDAGVTTVVLHSDPISPTFLTTAATKQGFRPEWVITGANQVDNEVLARNYDQEQWAHAFGPATATIPPDETGTIATQLHRWYYGTPPAATGLADTLFSAAFAVLFTVQQMGPHIDVAAFRDVMFTLEYPKFSEASPTLTFGNHDLWPATDYTGVDDQAEVWWNPDAASTTGSGRGAYEFVDDGRRHLPDDWPRTPPDVFDPTHASTTSGPPPEAPGYRPLR